MIVCSQLVQNDGDVVLAQELCEGWLTGAGLGFAFGLGGRDGRGASGR